MNFCFLPLFLLLVSPCVLGKRALATVLAQANAQGKRHFSPVETWMCGGNASFVVVEESSPAVLWVAAAAPVGGAVQMRAYKHRSTAPTHGPDCVMVQELLKKRADVRLVPPDVRFNASADPLNNAFLQDLPPFPPVKQTFHIDAPHSHRAITARLDAHAAMCSNQGCVAASPALDYVCSLKPWSELSTEAQSVCQASSCVTDRFSSPCCIAESTPQIAMVCVLVVNETLVPAPEIPVFDGGVTFTQVEGETVRGFDVDDIIWNGPLHPIIRVAGDSVCVDKILPMAVQTDYTLTMVIDVPATCSPKWVDDAGRRLCTDAQVSSGMVVRLPLMMSMSGQQKKAQWVPLDSASAWGVPYRALENTSSEHVYAAVPVYESFYSGHQWFQGDKVIGRYACRNVASVLLAAHTEHTGVVAGSVEFWGHSPNRFTWTCGDQCNATMWPHLHFASPTPPPAEIEPNFCWVQNCSLPNWGVLLLAMVVALTGVGLCAWVIQHKEMRSFAPESRPQFATI